METSAPVVEVNGAPVTPADLELLAFSNYGHYTSMQVRQHAVRGLDLHLSRLDENARILFGQAPDPGQVRDCLRHAVGTGRACSVQVTLFSRALRCLAHGSAVEPDIMVSVSPPDEPQTSALRVRCADYERETPEVKHLATYGLLREVRAARTAGFDDALFVDRTGLVSEGSTWNVCFHDGHQWVWPNAPALRGVTMQLLQTAMREAGVPVASEPVLATDLGKFTAAFATNSVTAARPLTAMDALTLKRDDTLLSMLHALYDTVPWQPL